MSTMLAGPRGYKGSRDGVGVEGWFSGGLNAVMKTTVVVTLRSCVALSLLLLVSPLFAFERRMWLRADKGITQEANGRVSRWADQSGNGRDATQATDGRRPSLVATGINDAPALRFDGSTFLNLPDATIPPGNSSYTIVMVVQVQDYEQQRGLFGSGQGATRAGVFAKVFPDGRILYYWWGEADLSLSRTILPRMPYVLTFSYDNTKGKAAWINGVPAGVEPSTARSGGTGSNVLGAINPSGAEAWKGEISEVQIFDSALTDGERSALENELISRYVPSLIVETDQMVSQAKPVLINIPDKGGSVQLRPYLVRNGKKALLGPGDVTYSVTHPVKKEGVGDPASIVSVDANGVAKYLREGYVLLTASAPAYHAQSDPVILATGKLYGDPSRDKVIAVFPANYTPSGSGYSFGDMLNKYPDYIRTLNLGYDIESNLYGGFRPFNGETEIFALLVLAGHCGGNGNPLETAPCCYMNCGNGEPQYTVAFHELGHNFSYARGMWQLLTANNSRIGRAGFMECVASLPVIYMAAEFNRDGAAYGLDKYGFESTYFRNFLFSDIPYARTRFTEFESLVASGKISGAFDESSSYDHVATFCSFFQQYAYNLTSGSNTYGDSVISRFLSLFPDSPLPEFVDSKVDTYFAAAYSAAVGADMRVRMRSWGFAVDDAYFDRLYSNMSVNLNSRRRRSARH